MMQPSQAQLYPPPGTLGYYPQPVAPSQAAVDLLPEQPNQPQQGPRDFLSRGLCCFQRSAYTRYGSIVLAILVIIHGVVSISIASAAEAEVRGKDIKHPRANIWKVHNAPTFTFYGAYVSAIGRIVIEAWKELGLMQAILLTLIIEILPGGVLIAAALLLKEVICIVAAVPFGLLFLVNAIEFMFVPLSQVRFFGGGSEYDEDGDLNFLKYFVLPTVPRFFVCALAASAFNAAIGLKRQIRKGVYDFKDQQTVIVAVPAPMVYAGAQGGTVVGEQPYATAGTMVAKEEPVLVENSS